MQEILTVKSDDVTGRVKAYEAIVKGQNIPTPGVPESFKVLVKELQALCLDVKVLDKEGNEIELSSLTEEELQTPNYVSGAALEDAVEPGEMVLDESELEGSFHEATDDELAEAYFGGSHTEDEE